MKRDARGPMFKPQVLQNFQNLRIVFQQCPNSTLDLVNSFWKETHEVPNLTIDFMLYSSGVPCRPMSILMPN